MSKNNLTELLIKLKTEIGITEIDAETRTILHGLESEIHSMLNDTSSSASTTMMETAELLETKFATEHPIAEGVVREIINALAKMGI